MRSDAVSEVFGAILAFSITSFIVFISLLIFDDASDQAERTAAVAESVAIAKNVDQALMDLVALKDDPNVASFELDLQLPRRIQGHPYELAMDADTFYLNVTNLGIEAVYPLRVANVSEVNLVASTADYTAVLLYDRAGYDSALPLSQFNLSLT